MKIPPPPTPRPVEQVRQFLLTQNIDPGLIANDSRPLTLTLPMILWKKIAEAQLERCGTVAETIEDLLVIAFEGVARKIAREKRREKRV